MTSLSNWNEEWKSFIIPHLPNPPPHVSICKKNQLEAKGHYDNTSYIPKWK